MASLPREFDRTYEENVAYWKKKYGLMEPTVNLTRLDITEVQAHRRCVVCSSTDRIARHHKARDYRWACYRPDRYARRYISFIEEDWDYLCGYHHSHELHLMYTPIMQRAHRKALIRLEFHELKLSLTVRQIESYRQECLALYDKWLERTAR